jgi:hypothetical protein
MDAREMLRSAVDRLAGSPRRAVASGLAVFWGSAAMVFLLAAGEGLGAYMKQELSRFGRGAILILPAVTSAGFPGYRKGVWVRISRDDAAAVERGASRVVAAVLAEHISRKRVLVEAGPRARRLDLVASDERYATYRNFAVGWGRFFDAADLAQRRHVAVLAYDAAAALFPDPERAVGATIRVNGESLSVVGVAKRKGRQYVNTARPDDRLLLVPATLAESRFGFDEHAVSRILLFPRRGADSGEVMRVALEVLGPRAGFHPLDREAVKSFDSRFHASLLDRFMIGFKAFTGTAAVVTLLIGAVGIANSHLAAIAERSVSLAVARALGARRRVLVIETLFEAVLLSSLASLGGTLFGLALCALVGRWAAAKGLPAPRVSTLVIGANCATLIAVNVLAAAIPAARVRRIDISLALRGPAR